MHNLTRSYSWFFFGFWFSTPRRGSGMAST
jgi:hypothetical protein